MRRQTPGLTSAEWHLMESLWERSPKTGRELTEDMAKRPRTLAAAAAVFLVMVCVLVGCTFIGAVEDTMPTEPPETTLPPETTAPTEPARPADIVLSTRVTYAIRQPELDYTPYGNVDEGTGEWEGWLIFHTGFSVYSEGDGLWRLG